MKKKEERRYFDKEWKEMKASLKAYLQQEQQHDLHQFRIQVKKIRAFLILSESTEHHPKLIKCFKPVKKIFKKAGEIRNAYINIELGKTYKIQNDVYLSHQQELQSQTSTRFKANGPKYLKKVNAVYKALKEKIKSINNVHISLFYQNNLQLIASSLAGFQFNEALHTNRKLLKVLIYNHKLTHPVIATGFNERYLDQVQTAIGNWHDHVQAIDLFSGNPINDETAVASLKKQNTKYKNRLTRLTKDLYNQATTTAELPIEQVS
ncbi:MAG: CHAD domain-containing protein [Mucilaginibacter sp.]|uniref:CHAD domain-containing protein n=1 Tax=Mucilaginibacter sp. TaxID=1882438 RepID=UPI0031AA19B1